MSGLSATIGLAVLFAAAAVWTVDDGLRAMAAVVSAPDETFESVLLRQVLLVTAWLLPLAVALGCAFPFAIRTGTGNDDSLGADLGLIYAFNTIGAIAGALAAGFVIIPALGLHGSLRASASAPPSRPWRCSWPAGPQVPGAPWAWPPARRRSWPAWRCRAGIRRSSRAAPTSTASAMSGDALQVSLWAGYLAYYEEGATATVAVRQAAGTTSLSIDGKVDASNAGDMLTQRLLAHVPLLLHPNPKTVAVLGLGSGVTLGSALTHPVERADVLEISPEVVEASRFFEPENGAALSDPRTRLILGDGRTHILLGQTQYDAIISEPSNPWMAGIAALFTQEFFEAAKARLTPGGVLCQWAHTYDISGDDLKSIVATFASVFPDATLWLVGDGRHPAHRLEPVARPTSGSPAGPAGGPDAAAANLAGVGVKRRLRAHLAARRRRPGRGDLLARSAVPDRRPCSGRVHRPAGGLLARRPRQFRRPQGAGRRAARRRRRRGPPPGIARLLA